MQKLAVKVNDVCYICKFNLSNTHNIIGSCNFVQKLLLCSLGIKHADYMSNLNNLIVKCLLIEAKTFILLF